MWQLCSEKFAGYEACKPFEVKKIGSIQGNTSILRLPLYKFFASAWYAKQ